MRLDLLKESYVNNEVVRAICEYMSDRLQVNQTQTHLHRVILALDDAGYEFKRSELIAAFRALEVAECGQYIEGRHGWKSRFFWSVPSKRIASAAQETHVNSSIGALDIELDEQTYSEMSEHVYLLRPDFPVSFELPTDLTRLEAQRLSQFIDTLSFDD